MSGAVGTASRQPAPALIATGIPKLVHMVKPHTEYEYPYMNYTPGRTFPALSVSVNMVNCQRSKIDLARRSAS